MVFAHNIEAFMFFVFGFEPVILIVLDFTYIEMCFIDTVVSSSVYIPFAGSHIVFTVQFCVFYIDCDRRLLSR